MCRVRMLSSIFSSSTPAPKVRPPKLRRARSRSRSPLRKKKACSPRARGKSRSPTKRRPAKK